jgi:hypothetical protein
MKRLSRLQWMNEVCPKSLRFATNNVQIRFKSSARGQEKHHHGKQDGQSST